MSASTSGLLQADELGAVALQLLAAGADGTQGLALVDHATDLVAERLDGWEFDNGCVHDRVFRLNPALLVSRDRFPLTEALPMRLYPSLQAGVAELVDATGLGPVGASAP